MPRPPRILPLIATIALLVSACAGEPAVTEPAASSLPGPTATPAASPGEVPFEAAAWPVTGYACGTRGYTGEIGRIEAVDARTVRFTLCAPDGAFLARIAHPALGILDRATIEGLAADEAAARSIAGTGPYRIDRWDTGTDVTLVAASARATPLSQVPTVVVRWVADASRRTLDLQSAAVDGIDAPGPQDIGGIETQPELALLPRTGLATAYLAFGHDRRFDDVRVRRAVAGGLDRAALVDSAFPAGSAVPTHLAPCAVAGACAGKAWYAFDAPAAAAALAAASFNLRATYPLHVPSRPVPGLPDPLGVAAAVQAQLLDTIGLRTAIDIMDPGVFLSGADAGTLDGLYLSGVESSVADPAAFLAPLFGKGSTSSPAARATGVARVLAVAAATPDAHAREAAFGRANDAIRNAAPLVPLAHPGSVVAFRSDVRGVVTSPLGIDPLGAFTPGDRRQLVFLQATQPTGAYCGDQASADAFRLCALVTDPLYGFAPGTLTVEPRLAERCSPNEDATVWTCRLRAGVTFHDGARLDAGDVLATYVAQWDASQPLRTAHPEATFQAWGALFGGFLGVTPR